MVISPLRRLAAPLVALALAACAHPAPVQETDPNAVRTPDASASGMLLDGRGVAMSFEKAVHLISFAPLLPIERVDAIAVIPPLGNDDSLANRGIAFEFTANGAKMILSEWPAQNFRIAFAGHDASAVSCKPVAYSHNGIVWTTPKGLVLTLQPDGGAKAARIAREANALIARGCR